MEVLHVESLILVSKTDKQRSYNTTATSSKNRQNFVVRARLLDHGNFFLSQIFTMKIKMKCSSFLMTQSPSEMRLKTGNYLA